jgi:phosphatidylglycerophosphate synthase
MREPHNVWRQQRHRTHAAQLPVAALRAVAGSVLQRAQSVPTWPPRALWRALALPGLAVGLGCQPSSPWLWGTYVAQQADLAMQGAHPPGRGPRRATVPWATECTLLRAYAAAALLAGSATPRRALALGLATDILDGYLARRSGSRTPLGARLDGLYDAYLLLAAAHAARCHGGLTRCTEHLLWLRFGAVLLAGGLATVATGRPITIQSTWPGKVASGLQAATVYRALAAWPAATPRAQAWTMALGTALAVSGQVARLWTPGPRETTAIQ